MEKIDFNDMYEGMKVEDREGNTGVIKQVISCGKKAVVDFGKGGRVCNVDLFEGGIKAELVFVENYCPLFFPKND